jgi:hypothetical protein
MVRRTEGRGMKHTDLHAVWVNEDTTKIWLQNYGRKDLCGGAGSTWNTLKPNLKIIYKDKLD